MTDSNNSLRNIMVSFDAAYEAAEQLEDKQVIELEGVTMYSGKHPQHGSIHITIPAIGDGLLLLPFALHDF